MRDHRELMNTLLREVEQSERSADLHGKREARRLGDCAPGRALTACAEHARAALPELDRIIAAEKLPVGGGGRLVGRIFSLVRETVADRLLDRERSYRGTLLGLRHGVDTVLLLRHVADACGDVEIAGWCTRWLEARRPMVDEVEKQLTWFAHHPGCASEPALPRNPLRRWRPAADQVARQAAS